VILFDSSGLLAALRPSETRHDDVMRFLAGEPGPFVLSPVTLCETDHLLRTRFGVEYQTAFLDEVADGAYDLPPFGRDDVRAAVDVIRSFRDLGLSLADASIVVLAGRYGTNRVLTLDERHFRALRTPSGDPFAVLPADA
jgi:predicted nucleic acid-binding protein